LFEHWKTPAAAGSKAINCLLSIALLAFLASIGKLLLTFNENHMIVPIEPAFLWGSMSSLDVSSIVNFHQTCAERPNKMSPYVLKRCINTSNHPILWIDVWI
jgi:hypothetical protein